MTTERHGWSTSGQRSLRFVLPGESLALPADHVCRCGECDPSVYAHIDPDAGRLGEHHFSVRLGDVFPLGCGRRIVVTVDGEVVEDGYETIAGQAGLSCAFSQPRHVCRRCGTAPCISIREGLVRVSIVPEDPVAPRMER